MRDDGVASGDLAGFVEQLSHSTTGTANPSTTQFLDLTLNYPGSPQSIDIGGVFTIPRCPRATDTTRRRSPRARPGSILTSLSYSFHSGVAVNMVKVQTVTNQKVTTANNGSDLDTTTKSYMRSDGTVAFREDENGFFSYTAFSNGRPSRSPTRKPITAATSPWRRPRNRLRNHGDRGRAAADHDPRIRSSRSGSTPRRSSRTHRAAAGISRAEARVYAFWIADGDAWVSRLRVRRHSGLSRVPRATACRILRTEACSVD